MNGLYSVAIEFEGKAFLQIAGHSGQNGIWENCILGMPSENRFDWSKGSWNPNQGAC